MRRAALVSLALAGCDQAKPTPAPARVVAVAAQPSTANEGDFCDVRFTADAPAFALPPVEGTVAARAGARWVNVWASWCDPCTEELPLVRRLTAQLGREGVSATLVLLSVDGTADAVDSFARAHPDAAGSLRLREAKELEPWLAQVGLGAHATLPVHLFVDAAGRLKCTRTGAIGEADYPTIKQLLR